MAKRIEIIGQALVITDTVTGVVDFEAPKGDYYYRTRDLVNNNLIKLYNLDQNDAAVGTPKTIQLSNAVDESDTPFNLASFQTFARENLGFKTASGGSGAVISDTTGEPAGATTITNIVQITQANYDAGTPVAGTAYLIIP